MRKTFAVLGTAQRTRLLSTLLLLTLAVPACGESAGGGDPAAMPGHSNSVAVRDVRIPEPEPAIGCDAVAVVNGGLTAGDKVTIPELPASRRESEVRQLLEAAAESPKAGFFARVLQPLLLRVARRIIAFQFRELIPGGPP